MDIGSICILCKELSTEFFFKSGLFRLDQLSNFLLPLMSLELLRQNLANTQKKFSPRFLDYPLTKLRILEPKILYSNLFSSTIRWNCGKNRCISFKLKRAIFQTKMSFSTKSALKLLKFPEFLCIYSWQHINESKVI